jgi:hypothetical protein
MSSAAAAKPKADGQETNRLADRLEWMTSGGSGAWHGIADLPCKSEPPRFPQNFLITNLLFNGIDRSALNAEPGGQAKEGEEPEVRVDITRLLEPEYVLT